MLNDWREPPQTVESDLKSKIAVALFVALGFGAIGTYAYESGTHQTQAAAVIAPHNAVAATPDTASPLPPDASAPDSAISAPEPVKNAAADVPLAPQPESAARPVKVARVQRQAAANDAGTADQAAAAKAPSAAPKEQAPVEAAPAVAAGPESAPKDSEPKASEDPAPQQPAEVPTAGQGDTPVTP